MKIRIIGAGPGGLLFASLMKRANPNYDIVVHERGPRDATWGFGVVFSDRALEFMRADDEEMYQLLLPNMEQWPNLMIAVNDHKVPVTGNGFAAIGRLEMLTLMFAHAEKLGVDLRFESEINSLDELGDADLIVAANGASSWVREQNMEKFGTTCDWRPNKFMWYGTSKVFDALSLTFRDTPEGVFCAHHYRYSPKMSTFLVEVTDATWHKVGFDKMNPEETIRYCEEVFAPDLDGHPILSNNSYWRNFPAIWNERWSFDNVVLIGDALRTAHFSIGSGTRLAMEDSITLFKALQANPDNLQAALRSFKELREPPMRKIWNAANVSLRWYEKMDELVKLDPVDFCYSYMTRTGRVDHAELARRDPELAAAYLKLHPELSAKS
ncbi:monooxygenase, FAD-binding (plasmid) [Rhizorhabdus wittichii RW1]|uniref:Monooxygenase, FAD-binding n=1 Tax=Rhizorhabdus wittichii (strain DSM 6014 / CCUG 31198 / JCM 15750 / NBRC 105917 / EY 4224 / RW1) TaxID=392499 RepID=A0A9J9HHM8_RHIWR|nr:monooxygenase, FAD-binding [Rhizorhabdus wittichii RW1]